MRCVSSRLGTRGASCALLASVVGSLASIAHAQPGSIPCDPPPLNQPFCDPVPVLGPLENWASNTTWTPNRLPGVVIKLMNGNFCATDAEANYRGLPEWWCDPEDSILCSLEEINGLMFNGAELLVQRMEQAYAQGFRRFMLYVPAGNV